MISCLNKKSTATTDRRRLAFGCGSGHRKSQTGESSRSVGGRDDLKVNLGIARWGSGWLAERKRRIGRAEAEKVSSWSRVCVQVEWCEGAVASEKLGCMVGFNVEAGGRSCEDSNKQAAATSGKVASNGVSVERMSCNHGQRDNSTLTTQTNATGVVAWCDVM
ncbi:unnamed protein product [Protopolystoma xenopodis]|uniref:Uncharacterized protein n=1 Tax=Protopolystoma xenopodis TaxID=117903 RepID=A0A448WMM3_9PLAT|nr:unnamed protein product [Protopolystoma xenopodis]